MISRKTILINLSCHVIILNAGKFKVIRFNNKNSIKKLIGIKSAKLEKITKNLYEILKLKGDKKVNLLLFMLLKQDKKLITQIINTLLLTEEQKAMFKLLNFDKETWDILKKNNFKLAEDLKTSLEEDHDSHSNMVKKYAENNFEIEKFMVLYNSMIKCVLNDEKKGEILPRNPFYPEIDLYNEYLLSVYDIESFSLNLLNKQFTTVNERGIRDFIKRKIEGISK